jgi:hypothetical protein
MGGGAIGESPNKKLGYNMDKLENCIKRIGFTLVKVIGEKKYPIIRRKFESALE